MPRTPSRLRDWVFGAPLKRRLVEVLVREKRRSWRQSELADAIGANPKGSINEHLAALVQLEVLSRQGDHYHPQRRHPLFRRLRALVVALEQVPDADLERPR